MALTEGIRNVAKLPQLEKVINRFKTELAKAKSQEQFMAWKAKFNQELRAAYQKKIRAFLIAVKIDIENTRDLLLRYENAKTWLQQAEKGNPLLQAMTGFSESQAKDFISQLGQDRTGQLAEQLFNHLKTVYQKAPALLENCFFFLLIMLVVFLSTSGSLGHFGGNLKV